MTLYLSHILNDSTPLYGNQGELNLHRVRSISKGDTSNNTEFEFAAHTGTHIDAPYHFDAEGQKLDCYPADFWICSAPYLILYEAKQCEILDLNALQKDLEQIPEETDLLLIKTGFEAFRKTGEDSDYIFRGPGLAPELGQWLRKYRKIRMIGFDFISVTSYSNRPLGREAHRAFLASDGAASPAPILIIEDMKLKDLHESPSQVWVAPLRFSDADGAPVTVIAE